MDRTVGEDLVSDFLKTLHVLFSLDFPCGLSLTALALEGW